MAKKKQRPVVLKTPDPRRQPKFGGVSSSTHSPSISENPEIIFTQKIAWKFSRMDDGGKAACSLKLLHDYIDRLKNYEKLTREDIVTKNHCHPMSPNKLSKIGKKRLEVLKLEEPTLYQLDFGTPVRLWGIWEHNIFNIIWLDKDHSFYESK